MFYRRKKMASARRLFTQLLVIMVCFFLCSPFLVHLDCVRGHDLCPHPGLGVHGRVRGQVCGLDLYLWPCPHILCPYCTAAERYMSIIFLKACDATLTYPQYIYTCISLTCISERIKHIKLLPEGVCLYMQKEKTEQRIG